MQKRLDIDGNFHSQLIDSYKTYLNCGGMPEAVICYIDIKDRKRTEQIIKNILMTYPLDFPKHVSNKDILRIHQVWNNLKYQLAKENRKFRYLS